MPINNFLTSLYGDRINPITQKKAFHNGIDINGNEGQKIYAMLNGVVIDKYYSKGYGNVLVYEGYVFDKKIKVFMAHLENSLVSIGDEIVEGEEIAVVGNTGNSTGTHLHLSIYCNDKIINPLFVLSDSYFK